MSVGANICVTAELAIRVGALATMYSDCSVEIAYDDTRAEQLWQATFDNGDEQHRYIVNDETGEAWADTTLEAMNQSEPNQ